MNPPITFPYELRKIKRRFYLYYRHYLSPIQSDSRSIVLRRKSKVREIYYLFFWGNYSEMKSIIFSHFYVVMLRLEWNCLAASDRWFDCSSFFLLALTRWISFESDCPCHDLVVEFCPYKLCWTSFTACVNDSLFINSIALAKVETWNCWLLLPLTLMLLTQGTIKLNVCSALFCLHEASSAR